MGENTKHITEISFEGRHLVEEGLEFEIDIDLLAEAPFFDVEADCFDSCDEYTAAIVQGFEAECITYLWKTSRNRGGAVRFTTEDLIALGGIFSKAMKR